MQEENRAEEKETKVAKARKARVQLRTKRSQPTLRGSVLSTRSWPRTRTSNIFSNQEGVQTLHATRYTSVSVAESTAKPATLAAASSPKRPDRALRLGNSQASQQTSQPALPQSAEMKRETHLKVLLFSADDGHQAEIAEGWQEAVKSRLGSSSKSCTTWGHSMKPNEQLASCASSPKRTRNAHWVSYRLCRHSENCCIPAGHN